MNCSPRRWHDDAAAAQAAGGPRQPCLLVVDDQPVNVQALYQAFAADHQVLMATSGEQALALCASRQPDLVLLDVVMPGMDGYQVCRRLKADAATRDIPVIFVTAHDDEAAETLGLEVGAVDFISKPINPKIVRARVRTHLTLKAQSDLLRQLGLSRRPDRRAQPPPLRRAAGREWARAHAPRHRPERAAAGRGLLQGLQRPLRPPGRRRLPAPRGRLPAARADAPATCWPATAARNSPACCPTRPCKARWPFARQLAADVAALGLAHAGSAVAGVVTVSVGACTKPFDGAGTAAALLREADAQLYLAKTRGRNQVCGAELPGV